MLERVPQVLGRTQPNGDSLLSVSAVVDGIVTFEDVGDAERFAALLEADGIDEVPMALQLSPSTQSCLCSASGLLKLMALLHGCARPCCCAVLFFRLASDTPQLAACSAGGRFGYEKCLCLASVQALSVWLCRMARRL